MTDKKSSLVAAQEIKNAIDVFSGGRIDALLSPIEDEVRSVVHDVSTPAGRKEIASLAYKISRSKTALDALGKGLVSEWKEKAKAVDSERKEVRDRLDSLKEEIRKPLTEWEEAESARLEKERLEKEIASAHDQAIIENDLFDRQVEIERNEERLRQAEQRRMEEERAEEEARLLIERENHIKRMAAEAAKREAEEKARLEREEAERRIIDARLAAEAAEREKEAALRAAEERRVRELKEQEERAREEQAEKQRKEAAERKEAERKAANKRHQKSVNNAILAAIINLGISEDHAKQLITKAAMNEIPRLKIEY